MRSIRILKRMLFALALSLSITPHLAVAQSIKGANWLRVDHDYATGYPSGDVRRVGWNLEYATNAPEMLTWDRNYTHLHTLYGIRTIFRLGEEVSPTAAERTALAAASGFSCTQISTLMNALSAEADKVPAHASVAAFTLGNEPNLPDVEWNIDGRAYGRIYSCYRNQRWSTHRHSNKPLLAAVPGGCLETQYNCSGFFSGMLGAMGSTIDGFAVHAYGQDGNSFQSDLLRQTNTINLSSNLSARGKPIYITEYNPGAVRGGNLPIEPDATYFNWIAHVVSTYNASNNNQIRALMYFVDSPEAWVRNGHLCHPSTPTPPTGDWGRTSLCYYGPRRSAWLNATPSPPPQPLNAQVTLSGLPFFMMPGEIRTFAANAKNIGTTTWAGGGASSMFRLGATGANGFMFSAFPQCGGYTNSVLDARVYTCNATTTNFTNVYRVDARAPVSALAATFQVKMVLDGVAWFGNAPSRSVEIGQAYCGTALSQCILRARPDILPFYQGNGWNISCAYRDAIVSNWCGIDPFACNTLKTGTCATFNNSCRCSGGVHLGGVSIDTNGTYCGYQHCGTNRTIYSCGTGNTWVNTGRACK